MNATQIDDALSTALNALLSVQATLRKAAPASSGLDILRKADLDHAESKDPLAVLADAERRMTALEAGRELDAQHERRKTAPREASQ